MSSRDGSATFLAKFRTALTLSLVRRISLINTTDILRAAAKQIKPRHHSAVRDLELLAIRPPMGGIPPSPRRNRGRTYVNQDASTDASTRSTRAFAAIRWIALFAV